MQEVHISKQTLQRLPLYINYLNSLPADTSHVSATQIADCLSLNDVQVRKDLASVSSGGRPKTGYITRQLAQDIRKALACTGPVRFVIVGMGNMGQALAHYSGFAEYNLHLIAAFDHDPAMVGKPAGSTTVHAMDALPDICRQQMPAVGIITVPAATAQHACDALTGAGVPAIWNFAPVHLAVPEGTLLENENMAASLGLLSRHLATMAPQKNRASG